LKEATGVVKKNPLVTIAITGGISVYKIAEVIRLVKKANISVQIVATQASLNFVGEPTWSALSGNPVISSLWDQTESVSHVRIAKESDLVVIAPATADTISDLANAKANSAVTALALTTKAPIFLFPAMHTQMWEHPGTIENINKLIKGGIQVFPPESGALTSGDEGVGRLVESEDIAALIISHFAASSKPRILVTAGGTREFLDPVRFLGNVSSGKQGFAIAQQAIARGCETTLISTQDFNGKFTFEKVTTADEMLDKVRDFLPNFDILIMTAAVADFKPAAVNSKKIKKGVSNLSLDLIPTVDILSEVTSVSRPNQVIVGFSAETETNIDELVQIARNKLMAKKLDLICANDVSHGEVFNKDQTHVHLVGQNTHDDLTKTSKLAAASMILNKSIEIWRQKTTN
jgi:phosphopantothenoylcysteine decarboxylase/phosphopantothenate--cysteine ligase